MPRLGLFFEPDLMLNIFTQAVDYKGFMKFSPEPPARKSLVFNDAGVVELVDTRDLKSLSREGVPVQVRPPVPYCPLKSSGLLRAGFVKISRSYGNS